MTATNTTSLSKSASGPTAADTKTPMPKADLGWRPDLRAPLVMGLAGLLALQLLIALGQSLSAPSTRAFAPQTPLIDFEPAQVTAIRIEGTDGADPVRLERRDGGAWVIGELGDFPAAGFKADQLLTTLAALKRPLPVATSAEARERFKVADTGFNRRLTLEGAQGPIATLILGETPRFKRLFGRPADDSAVYELDLAIADVSNRRVDWLDQGQLRLDQTQITAIEGADWRLEKDGEGWRLANAGENEPLEQDKARELVRTLANLSYRDVFAATEAPAEDASKPVLELKIELSEGESRTYRIAGLAGSEDSVLKDAKRPQAFRLSKYDLMEWVDLDRSTLIVQPEPTTGTDAQPESSAPDSPVTDETPAPGSTPPGPASDTDAD
ncbi:DUF4340 domain-containing protein [Allochromatium vinosum]|uniref:DUF4340 domain-containing protein n=1 Tax=Allochromatium vinosum (strain ATCC 17899 / DSM 180 / NBRC 103801 / NCIMB 10441 / D) TaxID=572477 RepID=D3RR89_ALLVD|nr:DUF4340 domain-containing protein [Allochromatium vinosum]ADC61917.1 hypothetical protein Alvin_0974 [Allochromatium vinosum DSM 180]